MSRDDRRAAVLAFAGLALVGVLAFVAGWQAWRWARGWLP